MKAKHSFRTLLVVLATVALPASLHAEVIAHWTFDELVAEGHAFADVHGNLRAIVTDQSSATLDHGKDVPFGQGVSLGPGGTGLTIPSLPGIYEHSFTVAAWVKLADTKEQNYLLADWMKPNAYAFGFDNKGHIITNLRNEKVDPKKNTTSDIVSTSKMNIPITAGTWHHVAWVWDRASAKSGKLFVYLDGNKAGEASTNSKSPPTTIVNNNRAASIGFKADTKNAFHGSVDELWVFNDALTAEQVSNLMKSNDITSGEMLASGGPAAAAAAAAPSSPASPTTPASPTNTPAVVSTPTTPGTGSVSASANTPAPGNTASTPTTDNHSATATPADSGPIAFSTAGHNDGASTPAPAGTTNTTVSNAPAAASAAPAPASTGKANPPTLNFSTPNFSVKPNGTTANSSPSSDAPAVVAAVTPPHYTPARIAGIVASAGMSLVLSAFLFWASNERGKMRSSRR